MAPLPPFLSHLSVTFFAPAFPPFSSISKIRPDPKLGNRPPPCSIPRGISVAWKFHIFFFCPHEGKTVFRLPVLPSDPGKCPCPMLSVQKSCRPSTIHLSPSSPPSSKQRKENTIAPTLIFSQKKNKRKKKNKTAHSRYPLSFTDGNDHLL